MPLPTYKKQTSQVASSRQTAGGTSTASYQASAQVNQSLAQRLSSFSQQLHGMAGTMAQDQASKDAVRDIHNRKQKVSEINANENYTDEQKKTEIGKITEGTDRAFAGVYSRAYESAASSAYSNQIATDAKSAFDLAMVQAQGDPDAFMKAYSAFSKETVKGSPTEATSILAQQTTLKYGTAGYKSLMLAKMGSTNGKSKTSYKDNQVAISKQFSDAYYSGDEVELGRLGVLATQAGEAAVRNGFISEEEHMTNLSSMADRAVIDSAKRKFGEMNNEGMGARFYRQFRDAELEGAFETQDPDEIAKFKTSMLKQIKESNDFNLMRDREEAERFEVISDATYREGTTMVAQGLLDEAQITEWEAQGLIDTPNADNLRERLARGDTKMESDAKTLGRYHESTTLIDTDDEIIKNNPLLSEPDKTILLEKKEKLLATRFNWRTTNDGREAVRRIKSKFGIQEGTLMAKIDLDNQVMRDFDDLYKEFYAQVSQSENPSEDVLTTADTLLRGYEDKLKAKEEADMQAMQERRLEEAKNQASAYNSGFGVKIGWLDPVTAEDMMMEK